MAVAKSMPSASRMVVYGEEFQQALTAALAVAGTPPHDVIQLAYIDDHTVGVFARNIDDHMMVRVDVSLDWAVFESEFDQVVEISRADAVALKALKMKRAKDEDEPMLGLEIREASVTRTDESGLGLGVRMCRVRRATYPGQELVLGSVVDLMEDAMCEMSVDKGAPFLSAGQLKRAASVAVAIGESFHIVDLGSTETAGARALLASDSATVFASTPKKVRDRGGKPPEIVSSSYSLRVVDADPTGGIA